MPCDTHTHMNMNAGVALAQAEFQVGARLTDKKNYFIMGGMYYLKPTHPKVGIMNHVSDSETKSCDV